MSTPVGPEFGNGDGLSEEIGPDVIVDPVSRPRECPTSDELLLVIITLPPVFNWTRTMRRVLHWLRRGVPAVWVVEPAGHMLTIHTADQFFFVVLEENDELTGAPPFPDLRCRVADLFSVPEQ
jgi:hypothetical protein